METILMIIIIFIFIGLVLFAPYLIEWSMSNSLPFHAKDVFDVHYDEDTNILTFRTKDKYGEYTWRYKGGCTVWFGRKGRCHTLIESELHDIWKIATNR